MSSLVDVLRAASRNVPNERFVEFDGAIETVVEMLDTLIDARDRMIGSGPNMTALRNRADAVIAKARGGSPA